MVRGKNSAPVKRQGVLLVVGDTNSALCLQDRQDFPVNRVAGPDPGAWASRSYVWPKGLREVHLAAAAKHEATGRISFGLCCSNEHEYIEHGLSLIHI